MKNINYLLSIILFLALNISSNAQSLHKTLNLKVDDIDEYIEIEMKKRQIPGLTLGICEGNNLLRVASFGYADLQNLGPAQDNTIFELASITKQFTASAIILLLQDGKLKLEDRISNYIEDCPTAWKDITLKHLLTHTSGLPAIGQGFTGAFSFTPQEYVSIITSTNMPKDTYYKLVKTDTLDFAPGDKYSYSDTGYFLLGYIIDNISGSYRDFIQNRIFNPTGMTSSYILDQITVHKLEARGYTLRNDEVVNIRRTLDVEIPSHFGIFSNITDLQKWDAALNSNTLFTDESKSLLWKDTELNSGEFTGYGLGWAIKEMNNNLIVSHTGSTGTEMIKFVDEGVTFIVLTNLGNGSYDTVNSWGLASGVAKLLGYNYLIEEGYITKEGNKMITPKMELLNSIVGSYLLGDGQTRKIYLENDKLYYERSKNNRSELRALDNGKFIMLGIANEFILEISSENNTTLQWSNNGGVLVRQ